MKTSPLDLTSSIIAYESGELDEAATLDLFQKLVDTGLAWQLQGHYGRTAAGLLEAGVLRMSGVVKYKQAKQRRD